MVLYVVMVMLITTQAMDNFDFNILKLIKTETEEHWLSESQLNTLNSSNTHLYVGVRGFSNDDILMGRPYGGCAIFWAANLKASMHFVDTCNTLIAYVMMIINFFLKCTAEVSEFRRTHAI